MRWLRPLAMVLLGSAAALALVPSAVAVPANRTATRSLSQPIGSPGPVLGVDAAAVFGASCASCHGATGQGTSRAPSLVGVGAAAADFELRTGRMPFTGAQGGQAVRKPPAFDDPTIRALVDYVASLGPGPAIPSPRVDDAQVSVGQHLFVANCAPCHGATAQGGAVGGGALAPALDQATAVQVAEAMLIGPGQMPPFPEFTDAQRDAIVSFVLYQQHAPQPGGFSIGGIGPVPEGYVAWIGGMSLLLLIVLLIGHDWLGRRS